MYLHLTSIYFIDFVLLWQLFYFRLLFVFLLFRIYIIKQKNKGHKECFSKVEHCVYIWSIPLLSLPDVFWAFCNWDMIGLRQEAKRTERGCYMAKHNPLLELQLLHWQLTSKRKFLKISHFHLGTNSLVSLYTHARLI